MLGQHHPHARSDDGLDIALCRLDPDGGGVAFAGARLGLFVAQGGRVREIKGDRQSVGYRASRSDFPFRNHRVDLAPGDVCYMASDGFWDQAGGEQGFPFGKGNFEMLLARCHPLTCADQKEHLIAALAEYQKGEAQRDDLTVIGFRLAGTPRSAKGGG
jgi:serine phosphatase RsbU (regulator of sigma subunit)